MKPRSDSLLAKLSDEQQAQLYDWLLDLGYTKTLEKVQQALPDGGFGLKTYRSSLHRFYNRYSQQVRAADLAAAKENRSTPEDASILVSDAEQLLQYAAQQRASSPMDAAQFRDVSRWLATHKAHDLKRDYYQLAAQQLALARERLAFDRERYELDVARQVLIHYRELAKVSEDDATDDAEKINRARMLIFGSAP